jgi:hypothetical protein
VKELARSGDGFSLSSPPWWHKGFQVFTYVVSFGAGLITLWSIPEKDMKGNDHVLSDFYRWRIRTRDAFLGVDKVESQLRSQTVLMEASNAVKAATENGNDSVDTAVEELKKA